MTLPKHIELIEEILKRQDRELSIPSKSINH